MRAARLITMVLLLQSRPGMTAAELAAELEVSERTVLRDAAALSEAGVPVYAERGRTGGYHLVDGYRTRLTGLARGEAEALFLSGLPTALRDLGLQDAASAARLKVAAALTPALRDTPRTVAGRFHLDAPGWFQDPVAPALLPALAEAVRDDLTLRTRYRRGGAEADRALLPYGLVLKAGVWYLCARVADPVEPSSVQDGFRVYRVDRFVSAEPDGGRFERDADFDLAGFWAERSARFARSLLASEVTVRVSGAGAGRLPHLVDRRAAEEALAAAGPPDGDGWRTVTLPVESPQVAYEQLLALGAEAEVLAPPALRARFREAAARMHGRYR
ncbi:YafY family protein [Streptomyces sp. NBC_00102]|uniref:helix-turn-helix transcriptional regulator n=1 Tax=Streptomyces sp. NBC_00102 TaxID=2975652 RepID=UPI0022565CCF|nr:WYL domain-containing protein [Streptomyces sp. NBC_00102]MCX5396586.1 WYL domain-containing protein [Streptomyces sp. NBC_00102]